MISRIYKLVFLTIFVIILFSSCRNEEDIFISTSNKPALKVTSKVATLMQQISLKDGSNDNIIDAANCFSIQLPATVIVNGSIAAINVGSGFTNIENTLDNNIGSSVQLGFPVTIIFSDYTEVIINNQNELDAVRDNCNGENEQDEDIECVDFNYPISGITFDTVTEQTDSFTLNNDNQLYNFIDDLDTDDIVNINFPIALTLFDGTIMEVDNLEDLENVINNFKDSCDEDDDFDFADDDCLDCTPEQLESVFTSCAQWTVNKLRINNTNIEDNYIGYMFSFLGDGTITVQEGANTYSGTWSSSGTGENITFIIDIPSLTDFNGNWILHEIEGTGSQEKIELRMNNNRLRFKTTC